MATGFDQTMNSRPAGAPANPVLKDLEPGDSRLIYTNDQKDYISFLQYRIENARNQKNQPYPELNNKNYYTVYDEDEKISNTFLEAKKNDDDVIVSAGTVESKLDSILSAINNLNLETEIHCFDEDNNRLSEIATAVEDVIFQTEEKDGADEAGDDEKKILRQRELLKHGTCFVQEEWLRLWETKKKLTEDYGGQFKDFKAWDTASELVFDGPSRTLLHGPNVYLGNITEYFQEKQPYMYVIIHQDYSVARAKYGKFENWKYVKAGAVPSDFDNQIARSIFNNGWRLSPLRQNQVEIILYQDQPNDEFQILINGVLMLPIGFPLSAVSPMGKYNITKQVFRPINANFAYGKSFVGAGSVKEMSAILDEMLRIAVLKNRKSFTPPYANTSGRVISPKVLSPGRITMGITADALKPIGTEGQGVTNSEYNLLKELQDRIDKSTLSPQFQGQQGKSGTTATEILELQRQAKLTLGLTIAACTLLEKKLAYLRLWNVLANYFDATGTKVSGPEEARQLVKTYRRTNRQTSIQGEGMGERQVIPVDDSSALPNGEEIYQMEEEESALRGIPIRKIYLSRDDLENAALTWYVIVTPKEKETSSFYKLLFRDKLNDVLQMMQFGSLPNKDGLEEEFSRVWQVNRNKIFKQGVAGPQGGNVGPEMAGVSGAGAPMKGRSNQTSVPVQTPNAVGGQ